MEQMLIDSPKDKLACPYCAVDHNVEGGHGGFQVYVQCSGCKKKFGVIATPSLKFQTVMVLGDK